MGQEKNLEELGLELYGPVSFYVGYCFFAVLFFVVYDSVMIGLNQDRRKSMLPPIGLLPWARQRW